MTIDIHLHKGKTSILWCCWSNCWLLETLAVNFWKTGSPSANFIWVDLRFLRLQLGLRLNGSLLSRHFSGSFSAGILVGMIGWPEMLPSCHLGSTGNQNETYDPRLSRRFRRMDLVMGMHSHLLVRKSDLTDTLLCHCRRVKSHVMIFPKSRHQ